LSLLPSAVCGRFVAVIPLFSRCSPLLSRYQFRCFFDQNCAASKAYGFRRFRHTRRRLYDPLRFADKAG
jgi:hypothetical protein